MKIKYILLLVAAIIYNGCTADSKTKSKARGLEGEWELVEGYRSGKKTESLQGTYFNFKEDKMSTNLPIKGASDSPFTFKDNVLSQQLEGNLQVDYKVEALTEEQLKLSTNLRGLDFTFLLKRKSE